MEGLPAGVDYVDLEFLNQRGIIATGILAGDAGYAVIDSGPSTTLPTLKRALARKGVGLRDIKAILLTHIHIDHAGGVGSLLSDCPDAKVFVHARGAPHIADPSKLITSSGRLYGPDMERLWGEIRPVALDRLEILGNRESFEVVGHDVAVEWTPGHAWHHVSYFAKRVRVAFIGDAGGIRRHNGPVLPATPPPDIDLEAWRESTDRILSWDPNVVFLTHFGPYRWPEAHFRALWESIDDWSERVKALLDTPEDHDISARAFMDAVEGKLRRLTGPTDAEAYALAARIDFSWSGLARYWGKRGTRTQGRSDADG
jgi:glyoxylase-like metal-dependent hydrolase (beta-lactamase superfamily II)